MIITRVKRDAGIGLGLETVACTLLVVLVLTAVAGARLHERISCEISGAVSAVVSDARAECGSAVVAQGEVQARPHSSFLAEPPRPSPSPTFPVPEGYQVTWFDEFDGSALNSATWNVESFTTFGDGNQELACLTGRPENLRVGDGTLTLSARREEKLKCGKNDKRFPDGRDYSSAMVTTKGKQEMSSGRIDIRAKLPLGAGTSKGLWPAFWMRPGDGSAGEIDIMEAIGTDEASKDSANKITQTLHRNYTGGGRTESTTRLNSPATDFHDYSIEWEKGKVVWSIDGKVTRTLDSSTTPWINEVTSADQFLRMNLAVGGKWPGTPEEGTTFPADLVIDHVRVFSR